MARLIAHRSPLGRGLRRAGRRRRRRPGRPAADGRGADRADAGRRGGPPRRRAAAERRAGTGAPPCHLAAGAAAARRRPRRLVAGRRGRGRRRGGDRPAVAGAASGRRRLVGRRGAAVAPRRRGGTADGGDAGAARRPAATPPAATAARRSLALRAPTTALDTLATLAQRRPPAAGSDRGAGDAVDASAVGTTARTGRRPRSRALAAPTAPDRVACLRPRCGSLPGHGDGASTTPASRAQPALVIVVRARDRRLAGRRRRPGLRLAGADETGVPCSPTGRRAHDAPARRE